MIREITSASSSNDAILHIEPWSVLHVSSELLLIKLIDMHFVFFSSQRYSSVCGARWPHEWRLFSRIMPVACSSEVLLSCVVSQTDIVPEVWHVNERCWHKQACALSPGRSKPSSLQGKHRWLHLTKEQSDKKASKQSMCLAGIRGDWPLSCQKIDNSKHG